MLDKLKRELTVTICAIFGCKWECSGFRKRKCDRCGEKMRLIHKPSKNTFSNEKWVKDIF